MKVVMTKNLGSRDAKSLHLDHQECVEGAEVTAKEEVAEVLVRRGLAELVEEEKPFRAKPQETVKAKPVETAKAVSEPPKAKQ